MTCLPNRLSSSPGRPAQVADAIPTLSEVFPVRATDGAAPAFVAAHVTRMTRTRRSPVLWIQDRQSIRETGRPYLAGLARPPEMLCLVVSRAVDVLWAMEQGLGCSTLSAVVGEIWGNPPALDFTASKRLALRAEAHGVPAWLIRRGAEADLSAARERWRLSSLPSLTDPDDSRAPGQPQWRAELFRARWRSPGDWVVRHDAGTGEMVFDHGVARPATIDESGRQVTG